MITAMRVCTWHAVHTTSSQIFVQGSDVSLGWSLANAAFSCQICWVISSSSKVMCKNVHAEALQLAAAATAFLSTISCIYLQLGELMQVKLQQPAWQLSQQPPRQARFMTSKLIPPTPQPHRCCQFTI